MANLNLAEAFAKLGGRVTNRLHSRSAITDDGAMILSCSGGHYGHPSPGVLRYEDRLSRDGADSAETRALGQHLTIALERQLPIRMVVVTQGLETAAGKPTQTVHVRADLVGKLVKFDGDAFIVDFTRAPAHGAPALRRQPG